MSLYLVLALRNLKAARSVNSRVFFAILLSTFAALEAKSESIAFVEKSKVGGATHLEFKGLANWKYEITKKTASTAAGAPANQIVLLVPKLSPEANGLLRTLSDDFIAATEVHENALDEQTEIVFTLKTNKVDYFDYISEQPSRLIVDFFPKDETQKKAEDDDDSDESSKLIGPQKLPSKNAGKSAVAKSEAGARKPAASEFLKGEVADSADANSNAKAPLELIESDENKGGDKRGVYDAADPFYRRFVVQDYEFSENSIIASSANIYIRFPMLKLATPQLKAMLAANPIYEIKPQDNEENREARLVLTLFENKRPAIFLKTAKTFLQTHPNSKYEEIVRYMMADTYYQFWEGDNSRGDDYAEAIKIYRSLLEKHPKSPLAMRTELLVAYSLFASGNYLEALQSFQRFIHQHPDSPQVDRVKISLAQAFLSLNRFDEAMSELDEVEKTGKNTKEKTEAAYRKGDVAFLKQDFDNAFQLYARAVREYPAAERNLPNASYNSAESLFWQKKYKDAATAYRKFLIRHPEHEYGGYALTRLGELMEILGAGQKRAAGAWMESGFRYRGSPGADVSKVRLLTQRLPNMKDKELKESLKEIDEIIKSQKLTGLESWVAVLKADGFAGRKEYGKAAEGLIHFYQKNPQDPDLPKIRERIIRNLNAQIRDSVQKGDFIEALRQNVQYEKTWLKDSNRIDTRYFVANAYEQAGLFDEALKGYEAALNQLYSIRGTHKEKERSVFENMPSTDLLNLRIAAVAADNKDFNKALRSLKSIEKPEALEDKYRIEKAQLTADIAEARGQNDLARQSLQDLVNTWTGQASAVGPVYLRLAKIELANKDYKRALLDLKKIIDLQTDTHMISEEVHAGALELKGDLAMAQKDKPSAIKTYRELLSLYENTRPLDSVRYKLGQALFATGNLKEAESEWAQLKSGNGEVWAKLAQEQMQSAKWQSEYKKYVSRIPAMVDDKEKSP